MNQKIDLKGQEEITKSTQATTPKTIIKLTPQQKEEYKQNRKDWFKQFLRKKGGGIIRKG